MVNVTLNASDGRLVLPGGSAQLSATLNASSLEVCSPEAVPLEVQLNETLSSNDLGDAGLDKVDDDRWQSPGFSRTGDHQTLEITSTVSSLTIERPEACS